MFLRIMLLYAFISRIAVGNNFKAYRIAKNINNWSVEG